LQMLERSEERTVEAMARMVKNFIPRKCSINYSNLMYWLGVEEFLKDVTFLMDEGSIVDDQTLLNIMQNIYDSKEKQGDTGFSLSKARRGINQLKRALNA